MAVIAHGAELLAQVALSTALEELLFALEQNSSSPLKAKLYRVCPPGDYFRRKLTLASVKDALAVGCDASTLSDKVFKSGLGLPPHYDVMSHFVEMCREALLDRSGEPAVTLAGGWSSTGSPFLPSGCSAMCWWPPLRVALWLQHPGRPPEVAVVVRALLEVLALQ